MMRDVGALRLRSMGSSLVLATATALLLVGCAADPPSPKDELEAARLAVLQAEGSLAQTNAVEEVALARSKLRRAEAAYEDENYVIARRLAEQALIDARMAEVRADEVLAERSVS